MKLHILSPLKVLLLSIVLISQFSCSKDSDLLTDYVLADVEQTLDIRKYVVDDTYVFSSTGSIVLDVLSNDAFSEQENVTITETSTPTNGNVVINANETLTYTPEADTSSTDTFTYTTEVINEDQTVITEEGTVTVTLTDRTSAGEIVLNNLKAFPSAFGAGVNVTGGRGQSIYEVTNLNDSGVGSFRDAISSGNRIVIIKVEGIVNLSSRLQPVGADNITVWGQFAPGRGLTISGQSVRIRNSLNHIFRHLTFQNKTGETGLGSFGIVQDEDTYKTTSDKGYYIDHISARYGQDQVLDLIQRNASQRSTVAYNLVAVALEGHNTGGIFGNTGGQSPGSVTWARNMYYNISHRFPNIAGNGNVEVYNNYISNWQQRISAVSYAVKIDYFNNYAEQGNHSLGGSNSVNRLTYESTQWGDNTPMIYSSNNYMEAQTLRLPSAAPQKSVWAWRKTSSATIDGDPVVDGNQVDSPSLYTTTQQHNFAVPADGYWDVYDVPAKVQASVGHNRGINADGSPGFFRDNKDSDYINKSANGTTEATYRTSSQWDDASSTGTALYSDSDGDYMPDWFENQHAHLNPNDASDRDTAHTSWIFENYTVTNNAKYTNLEICAEFYAGGFETMIDGTNNWGF